MAHEKRLLIDVFQAYFYRKQKDGNRKLVFMSENLTSGSISTTQENTDVRNGQGNKLFAILPGSKDVTVALTENVFSFEALQLNSGIEEDATVGVDGNATGNSGLVFKKKGRYNATANKQIDGEDAAGAVKFALVELKHAPEKPEEMVVTIGEKEYKYNDTVNTVDNSQFILATSDDAVTFNKWVKGAHISGATKIYLAVHETEIDTKTKDLKILPYVYITEGAKTKTLTVKATDFAEGGELWLQTLEKDEKQKPTAYVYFVFENAMPEGSFEISTVSEVQPNDMTVNMRILSNENGELYRIIREEIPQA